MRAKSQSWVLNKVIHFPDNSHASGQMGRALCVWAASTREDWLAGLKPELGGLGRSHQPVLQHCGRSSPLTYVDRGIKPGHSLAHLVVPANSTAPATSSKRLGSIFSPARGEACTQRERFPSYHRKGSSAPGGEGRSLSSRARDVAGIPTHWYSPLVKRGKKKEKKREKKVLGVCPFALEYCQAFKEEGSLVFNPSTH